MAPAHSTQQQLNPERHDSTAALYLNDLVSLPIIITDFDAETITSTPDDDKKGDEQTRSGSASMQKWVTGFNDFADEMWRSMSDAMRAKLREAAVEVLKRTDDTRSGAGSGGGGGLLGEWDEDARFLD